jgi:flagellin-like hook-associated protein FlgL
MGLRIQNNVEAFNTHRQLTTTSSQAAKSMEKLSSGYRINRAADDAAGLAISEAASRRRSATRRTASRSSRRRKAR